MDSSVLFISACVLQMLALFKRSEDDNALLLRLVSAAGTDIQATEAGTMPEVTMAMMRQHEHLLQLLMHGWLQANSCLDTAGALSVRRCSAVFSLWCSLERVRANEAHAYNNTSPLACRYASVCTVQVLMVLYVQSIFHCSRVTAQSDHAGLRIACSHL